MKKKNKYYEIIPRYYDNIMKTGNPTQATEAAWEGVDMEQFTRDFVTFWNSRRMVTKSKSYDPVSQKK